MNIERFIKFRTKLENSWSNETTFCPSKYFRMNPARGNCGVTALILQDEFGGDLYEAYADKEGSIRHFFNVINNVVVDLTFQQFPTGTELFYIKKINREDILYNSWFVERYENLKKKVYENK